MNQPDHECDPTEVCEGVLVALRFDVIRPLFPQHDERVVRQLMLQHAEGIAAHMMSAGLEAALQLFNGPRGPS